MTVRLFIRTTPLLLALAAMLGPQPLQAGSVCKADGPDPAFSPEAAWTEVRNELAGNYAYWDRIDAKRTFDAATPAMLAASDRLAFADRLQTLLLLFRDSHLHVTPTTSPAMAWVPSAADIWFEAGPPGQYVVRDVKQGSIAAERGIRPGWQLLGIDGKSPTEIVALTFAPLGLAPDPDQATYALNALAAGRLKTARAFAFRVGRKTVRVTLPDAYASVRRPNTLLTVLRNQDAEGHTVAIIRINNSLGENGLIPAFDKAMSDLPANAHVVIDLRDTPSGGNSTVARSIIGHFISEAKPFQRHELTAERVQFGVPRIWIEFAQPRAPHFAGPVVLAGFWTGSMGEGLTVGLNAAAGSPVVGSEMGQLLGAIIQDELPASCLTVSFANERLWHIDGTPRESFVPGNRVAFADTPPDGSDQAKAQALALVDQSDRQ